MMAIVHGAVGAASGALLRSRRAAVVAAFLSHFAADAVNHDEPVDGHRRLRPELIAIDATSLAVAIFLLARRHGLFSPPVLAAFAACLPDLEHLLPRQFGGNRAGQHSPLPHSLWPARPLTIRDQFAIGTVSWLVVLASGRR